MTGPQLPKYVSAAFGSLDQPWKSGHLRSAYAAICCHRFNNHYDPGQILVGFILSFIAGAQRFAHANQLRADRALHALLGMKRFPSDDTILNYFRRFSQAEVERFWRPLWRWLISRLPQLEKGFSLDLDSTIFSRHGVQQTRSRQRFSVPFTPEA